MKQGDTFDIPFKVSKEVYEGFIDVFKDKNPLHTESSFATSHGFKSEVMHGNILNGFLSYFIGECLPSKKVIIQKQSISFALPVYIDDQLTLHAEIADYFESVDTYQFKFYFQNQDGKKVAKGDIQIGMLK